MLISVVHSCFSHNPMDTSGADHVFEDMGRSRVLGILPALEFWNRMVSGILLRDNHHHFLENFCYGYCCYCSEGCSV